MGLEYNYAAPLTPATTMYNVYVNIYVNMSYIDGLGEEKRLKERGRATSNAEHLAGPVSANLPTTAGCGNMIRVRASR